MAFSKLLTMVSMTTVLLLNLTTKADAACRCKYLSECELFNAADVVVKGTALEWSEPAGNYDEITYTLDAEKIYKQPRTKHDGNNEISFDTNASSAACGVHLELGKQYLLGLYQSDDGSFTANSCGLVRQWNAVTKEERASLKVGCEDEDPCGGSCSKFQADACRCMYLSVCQGFEAADVVVKGTALERSEPAGEYGEITYTLDAEKIYKSSAKHHGNNEISFNTNASSAACRVYLALGKQYLLGLYQSDDGSFTASSCGLVRHWNNLMEEETAFLKLKCEDEDPCGRRCNEFQECLFHSDSVADEYYCADVCDPSPCEEGEKCTLEQLVQCVRAPCPKSAVCNGSEP